MLATSITLPMELLRAAESLSFLKRSSQAILPRSLEIHLTSIDGEAIESHTGISLLAQSQCQLIERADIVYFPALWRNPSPVIRRNMALLPWIKKLHAQGSLIVGVGTGCCFLAEAGLLDSKPATTHWHYFDSFSKKYPRVILKRQHFITQSENLYCAGSVNSLADLTVHFIERYFTPEIALVVERNFFHEIRKAYDNENVFNEHLHAHPDEDIIQVQTWLRENIRMAINFDEVAKKFDMSTRNLNRRFKQATGYSPLKYLQKIRIQSAQDLLKSSNLSISETMYEVGYQDSTHFTTLFKKYNRTTPKQYRQMVRSKLFKLTETAPKKSSS